MCSKIKRVLPELLCIAAAQSPPWGAKGVAISTSFDVMALAGDVTCRAQSAQLQRTPLSSPLENNFRVPTISARYDGGHVAHMLPETILYGTWPYRYLSFLENDPPV